MGIMLLVHSINVIAAHVEVANTLAYLSEIKSDAVTYTEISFPVQHYWPEGHIRPFDAFLWPLKDEWQPNIYIRY
jgi:hypothetical protein